MTKTTVPSANGASVAPLKPTSAWEPTDAERAAIQAQGLNINATNMVEAIDRDWIKALADMNIDFEAIPSGTDYLAMREWISNSYQAMDRKVEIKPIRSPCSVSTSKVDIEYGPEDKFGVTIWEPSAKVDGEVGRPALLMYHGGGWIHGFPEGDSDFAVAFASNLRCVVIGVDYRLAPEHKLPTIVQDCMQALEWTISNASQYDIDVRRVGVWGASAGGHLAANVAMLDALNHSPSRIRQASLVVPATCHSDAYDSILATASRLAYEAMDEKGREAADGTVAGFRILLGYILVPQMALDDPILSPLRRPTPWPIHHAPTHTTVAGCDVLRDQGIAYALRLRDQRVDSTLQILPGVSHGFTWAVKSRAASQWLTDQIKLFENAFRGYSN